MSCTVCWCVCVRRWRPLNVWNFSLIICSVFEENWKDEIGNNNVHTETFQTNNSRQMGKTGEKDVSLHKTKYVFPVKCSSMRAKLFVCFIHWCVSSDWKSTWHLVGAQWIFVGWRKEGTGLRHCLTGCLGLWSQWDTLLHARLIYLLLSLPHIS